MTANASDGVARWFETEARLVGEASARLRVSESSFEERLARAAATMAAFAQNVEVKQAVVELRPRPVIDLRACVVKLREQGPAALSGRERRAVISHPGHVAARDAEKVLQLWPKMMRHLLRACLSDWYQFKGQPWGADYLDLICTFAESSGIPLLEKSPIGPRGTLSRDTPSGDAQMAASLPARSIVEVYHYLHEELGLRDSWLYTGQVLASWFQIQLSRNTPLGETLDAIYGHRRLRALLIPADPHKGAGPAGVRVDPLTQAQVVATLLRAAFASQALLGQARLADLTSELFRSTFQDPRLPPLSHGWELVKQLAEPAFRRLLASLSEQDLEVFFSHAMNEPDRRKFWTSYLPQIERTGCVLDWDSQERLRAKLQASPELKGAITRSHRFKRASQVQAFFLVFQHVVVVEFSDNGNAAYVYEREYFEKAIEKSVRVGQCDAAPNLKVPAACLHKIRHQSGWQEKTAAWLSTRGIHSRRGGR